MKVASFVIAIVFLVLTFPLTKPQPAAWNDIARVAAIESLVERGTWAIDDSPWVNATKDKVWLNGKFYSDKMPMLTLMGVGIYAPLHWAGLSLAPDCNACAYPWLARVFDALPAAITLALFFDLARRQNVATWIALLGTFALGIGTMWFPYALVLNHHIPAASAAFGSFYLIVTRREDRRAIFFAGVLAALAIAFDVLAGIVAATVGVIALVRVRREFFFFALGGALPLVLTALLDYQIAGMIIPPYMITNGYNYPGSEFPATFAGNGTPDDYAAYAFRMFLGGQGLFAYNPLLLFAIVGAIAVAWNRRHTWWIEGLAAIIGFAALCLYLATNTGNYGGNAYGERWFIPAIPLLFAFIFFAPPLSARTWKHLAWALIIPALALSLLSTWQGSQAPWQYIAPPLQMTRNINQFPFFGFKWNVH
ncbi:MAG: hypothetical protein HY868_10695 [Chloroflexi bacterium]|nr:hypothetical protein [Chloroflexota bacterium]